MHFDFDFDLRLRLCGLTFSSSLSLSVKPFLQDTAFCLLPFVVYALAWSPAGAFIIGV